MIRVFAFQDSALPVVVSAAVSSCVSQVSPVCAGSVGSVVVSAAAAVVSVTAAAEDFSQYSVTALLSALLSMPPEALPADLPQGKKRFLHPESAKAAALCFT